VADSASEHPVLGLVRESTYVYGTFRDAGAELHTAMRRFQAVPGDPPRRLLLQSTLGSPALRRHPAGDRTGSSPAVVRHLAGTTLRLDAPGEGGYQVEIGSEGMRWVEPGVLTLATGSEIRPGLQWYLPDPSGSMLYVSRLFEATGTVLDRPVVGFVGYDEVHLDAGARNYVDDPLTRDHLSSAWCTWASSYGDGTAEAGHVAFGPGGFGFAAWTDGGTARIGAKVEGRVLDADAAGAVRVDFTVDGQVWEYARDPRGSMPDMAGGAVSPVEGRLRRRGDDRTVRAWFASLEVPASPPPTPPPA
jgi:hypothetical protein